MLKVPEEAATVGSLQLKVRANLAGVTTGVDNQICPYFQILRYVEGAFEPMYRSKVVRNTDRPQFEDVHLPPHHVAHLVNDDVYIKFEVYDMESRGDPRCLGAIETTMSHMLADGKAHREKTGRSVTRWNGCHYPLGPQDTRKGELAKPVDQAPKGRASIKIAALFDDHRQKEAEAEAAKTLSQGGMAPSVKLAAPKAGMHKSGRKKLKAANALEAEGTASFGTFGEDERFLANLMLEQNIRETDLREVVDESLQYIDERRAHWLAETGKATKKGMRGGRRKDQDNNGRGFGAVLDWGDGMSPEQLNKNKKKSGMTKRAKDKEAAKAKRAELAAKSAARKGSKGEGKDSPKGMKVRQMAAVPQTDAYLDAEDERRSARKNAARNEARAAVENSRSMPELGSKEHKKYNVDDYDDDDGDDDGGGGSSSPVLADNAAAHGVLPRLNITQRWDTFDISARCGANTPRACLHACLVPRWFLPSIRLSVHERLQRTVAVLTLSCLDRLSVFCALCCPPSPSVFLLVWPHHTATRW